MVLTLPKMIKKITFFAEIMYKIGRRGEGRRVQKSLSRTDSRELSVSSFFGNFLENDIEIFLIFHVIYMMMMGGGGGGQTSFS